MHPLEAIQHWFDELHPDARGRASCVLMDAVPKADLRYYPTGADSERILREWLSARGDRERELGRILSMRALISFCLIREFDNPVYWTQRRILFEKFFRQDEEKGLMETWPSRQTQWELEMMSAMEEEWRLAARRWRTLCKGQLSDSAISEWSKAREDAETIRQP